MPRLTFEGPTGPETLDIGWNLSTAKLRLTLAEARHIQRVADMTVDQVRDKIFTTSDPDPVALSVLVQVLWKRQGRIVSFEDVDFDLGGFSWDLLPDEEAEAERVAAEQGEPGLATDAEDPTQPTPSGDVTAAG